MCAAAREARIKVTGQDYDGLLQLTLSTVLVAIRCIRCMHCNRDGCIAREVSLENNAMKVAAGKR
jgi:hypothetical protein